MFFFLLFMLILIAFICIKNRKSHQSILFAALLTVYFIAFSAMIIYLSKDSYYYNVISQYFYLPQFMWRSLFFWNISQFTVVRLLNLSSLGVVVCSILFALSYLQEKYKKLQKTIKISVIVYAVVVAALFDPWVNIKSYYYLYPDWMTAAQYSTMVNGIQSFVRILNITMVLTAAVLLLISLIRLPNIRIIRLPQFCLCTCYCSLCLCYCALLSFAPASFLNISKVSDSYRFVPIRLYSNPVIYSVLPYLLMVFTLLITYSMYRITKINRQIEEHNIHISKQISASETTSKVFCHYIKNEVLAIQSQIELLESDFGNTTENQAEQIELLGHAIERCKNLYNRIDAIHRSTKRSELDLREHNLLAIMQQSLAEFEGEIECCEVQLSNPTKDTYVLLDEHYFLQAIHNLIRNSLDAMQGLADSKKKIQIDLQGMEKWAVLSISDTGKGIAKENLVDIFTPFYSSSSFSQHWGMDLPLTYKIIEAHEGKIEVESVEGMGTTMRIILPRVNN